MEEIKYHMGHAPSHYFPYHLCASCGKKIVKGRYRYHMVKEKPIIFHQACCSDWEVWKTIEKEERKEKERIKGKLSAFKKFQKKWETTKKLDDEIYILERLLKD
jgi:hypothetical protein